MNGIVVFFGLTSVVLLSFVFYSENYKDYITYEFSQLKIEYKNQSAKSDTTSNKSLSSSPSILKRNLLKFENMKPSINVSSNSSSQIKLNSCPLIPPNLNGRIPVNLNKTTIQQIQIDLKNLSIEFGGLNRPKTCEARDKVAIIVPYRNRVDNLNTFLRHMHPFLTRQQIDYGIYIVEPLQNLTFNRGLLMNIGFLESLKLTNDKWKCFMFHDVDLLPEDDRNLYTCPETPRHMSSAVSTFNYILPYETIFGGVSSLTKEQMLKVNGYSNLYFGWGGEDDDFRFRCVSNGYKVTRYPLEIGRYLMNFHSRDQQPNTNRINLLNKANLRMKKEGLNSIKYKIVQENKIDLFTHILVSYDEKELMAQSPML